MDNLKSMTPAPGGHEFAPEYLHKILEYDSETGDLTWRWCDSASRVWNGRRAGRPALTSLDEKGYRFGRINKKAVKALRIIYAMLHGYYPPYVLHKNGVRADNRAVNLHASDTPPSAKNRARRSDNTSGLTGIYRDRRNGLWQAQIMVEGRNINLGRYAHKADAILARGAAERRYGFDPLHGLPADARADRR